MAFVWGRTFWSRAKLSSFFWCARRAAQKHAVTQPFIRHFKLKEMRQAVHGVVGWAGITGLAVDFLPPGLALLVRHLLALPRPSAPPATLRVRRARIRPCYAGLALGARCGSGDRGGGGSGLFRNTLTAPTAARVSQTLVPSAQRPGGRALINLPKWGGAPERRGGWRDQTLWASRPGLVPRASRAMASRGCRAPASPQPPPACTAR